MAHAALISPMWLNACGKFPIISPLAGRIGRIDVVWVAHLSITVGLSADAIVEMEAAFDEMEPELRAQAAGQLCGRGRTGSGPPFTGSPPDGAMGSRCSKPRPGPGIRRMRTVTPRSVRIIQIFSRTIRGITCSPRKHCRSAPRRVRRYEPRNPARRDLDHGG
jgi:hypothetical protein